MDGYSLTKLKEIAKSRPEIKGWSKLKKEDLLKLLKSTLPTPPPTKRRGEKKEKEKKEPKKEPKKPPPKRPTYPPPPPPTPKPTTPKKKETAEKRPNKTKFSDNTIIREPDKVNKPKPRWLKKEKKEVPKPVVKKGDKLLRTGETVGTMRKEPKRPKKAFKPSTKSARKEGEVPKRKPKSQPSYEFKLKKNTKTVPPTPRQPKKERKIIPPPKPPTSKEDRLAKSNFAPDVYKRLYEYADDDDGDIFAEMDAKAIREKPLGFNPNFYSRMSGGISAHPDDTNPMGDNPTGFIPRGFYTSPPKKEVITSKPIETATDKFNKRLKKKPRAETLDEIIERKADENKKRFIKKAPAPTKTNLEDNPSSMSFFHNSFKGIKKKPFVKKAPYKEPRKTDLNKKGKSKELISRENRLPVEKVENTPTTTNPAKTVKTTAKTNNLRVPKSVPPKQVSKVSKTRVPPTPNPLVKRKVKKPLPKEVVKYLEDKKKGIVSVPVSMPKVEYVPPPETFDSYKEPPDMRIKKFGYLDSITDIELSAEELENLKNRPIQVREIGKSGKYIPFDEHPPTVLESYNYSEVEIPNSFKARPNTVKGKEKGVPNPNLPDLFYPKGVSNYGNETSVLPAFLPKKLTFVADQKNGWVSQDTEYKTKSIKPSSYDRITPARRGQPKFVVDTTSVQGEFDNIIYPNTVRAIKEDLKEDRKRDAKALKASMETGRFINQQFPEEGQGSLSRSLYNKKIKKKGGDTFGQEFQDYKRINELLQLPFNYALRATHNRTIAEGWAKPIGRYKDKSGGSQLNPDFRRGAARTGYTDYRTYQAPIQDEGDFFGEGEFALGSNLLADLEEGSGAIPTNEGGLVDAVDVIGKQKKGKRTYPKPTKKELVEKQGANPFVRGGKERKLTGKFATSGKVRRQKDYKEPDEEEKKKGMKKVEFTKVGNIEKGSGKTITIAEGEWNGKEFIYNGKTKKLTADDPSLLALGGGGKKIYFEEIRKNNKDTEIVPVPKEIFRSAQSTVGRDKKLEGKMVGGEATEAQKSKLNAGLLKGIERQKARKEGKEVDDTNESVFTKKGKQEFADKYTRKGVSKEVIKRFLGEEVKTNPLTKYSSKEDAFTKMSKKLEKSLTSTGNEKSKKKDDEYIKKRKEFQDKFAEFMKTAQEKLRTGTAGENKKTSAQMTKKRERLDINLKKLAEKYGK